MISIIIPIYNVEDYVIKCVESVAKQTYSGDIECLLIDDCGTDGSMNLVRRFVTCYSGPIQFRILHHEMNRGVSAARNTGIKESVGEWLFFLDSDDCITPDCIDLLVKKSHEYPKAQIIQGGAITDKGIPIQIDMEGNSSKVVDYMDDAEEIKRGVLLNNTCYTAGNTWNKLIKKEFVIKYALFFKEGIIYEDAHWNFFVAKFLKAVAFVRKNTYIYTIRNNSIMHGNDAYNNLQSLNSWITMAEDFIANLDDLLYNVQIVRILIVTMPIYTSSHNKEYAKKSLLLIKEVSCKCDIFMQIKILCVTFIPSVFLKLIRFSPKWFLKHA